MPSIYVHIPYCHSKCAYCDFYSIPRADSAPRLVRAIAGEYMLRKDEIDGEPETLYIGGGTPSVLPLGLFEELAGQLPRPKREFTIEVNPEDVTPQSVAAWKRAGVNRVSMGVQSLVDSELLAVGRRHTARRAIEAVDCLRREGISNLSLDLIYGLPGQSIESWTRSLSALLQLRPEHLSAYILSYEPRTRLTSMLHAGKIEQTPDSDIEQMYGILCRLTREAGYEHYEISNFALPGCRSRHNSGYWQGTAYLGLGPSAHSYDGRLRRINPPSVSQYLSLIETGKTACEIDPEDDDNRFNDTLVTRLRTAEGLDTAKLDPDRRTHLLHDAAPLRERGLLTLNGTFLTIPEEHWLISDSIITDLIQI